MNLLADENFPSAAVEMLRSAGHDVVWVRTAFPGISDQDVLARATTEKRILITFDKDFGDLAFRSGLPSSCGIVLFRLDWQAPRLVAARVTAILNSRTDWVGNFAVADESRIRMRTLPN